jgi:hypothetical protein
MATLALFLLHCFAAFGLTGIAWFVQLVHYPLLREIPENSFPQYLLQQGRRAKWLLGGGMLLEMVTGIILLTYAPWRNSVFSVAMAILVGIWASILLLQIPILKRLAYFKDTEIIRRLITANWILTACWTGRSVLLILISIA